MLKTLVARSAPVVALVANLVLAATCYLSAGGQTQTVTLDVRGDRVQVSVDGLQVVPDPGAGQHTSLEIPESGTISFSASPPVPSLPDPQGIDSVVVSDAAGNVLFRDEFDSLELDKWQILDGSFEIEEGVLVASNRATANILELRGAGWRDHTLEVRFRNGGAEQLGIRRTGSGGLYYHVYLYHPTTWAPSYVAAYREDGAWTGIVWGASLNLDERGSVTSIVAMVVGSYPLLLLALAGGALVAVALAMLEYLLRPALPGRSSRFPLCGHSCAGLPGPPCCWPWH
jgi:hypothetical protein